MKNAIDYELIGARIKQRRESKQMTQETLANLVGCSKTHISNVENAHNIPSLEIILMAAQALETNPDEFLLGLRREKDVGYFEIMSDRMLLCSPSDREIIGGMIELMIEKRIK